MGTYGKIIQETKELHIWNLCLFIGTVFPPFWKQVQISFRNLLVNSVGTKHLPCFGTRGAVWPSPLLQTFCQAMNSCLFKVSVNLTGFPVQLNLFICFLRVDLLYLINSCCSLSLAQMFCQFHCIKINCVEEIIHIVIWSNPKDSVIHFILDNSITGEAGKQIFSTSAWQKTHQYHFINAHRQV